MRLFQIELLKSSPAINDGWNIKKIINETYSEIIDLKFIDGKFVILNCSGNVYISENGVSYELASFSNIASLNHYKQANVVEYESENNGKYMSNCGIVKYYDGNASKTKYLAYGINPNNVDDYYGCINTSEDLISWDGIRDVLGFKWRKILSCQPTFPLSSDYLRALVAVKSYTNRSTNKDDVETWTEGNAIQLDRASDFSEAYYDFAIKRYSASQHRMLLVGGNQYRERPPFPDPYDGYVFDVLSNNGVLQKGRYIKIGDVPCKTIKLDENASHAIVLASSTNIRGDEYDDEYRTTKGYMSYSYVPSDVISNIDWQQLKQITDFIINDYVNANGTHIVIGNFGRIATATGSLSDDLTWTKEVIDTGQTKTNQFWRFCDYGNGICVIAGTQGYIAYKRF